MHSEELLPLATKDDTRIPAIGQTKMQPCWLPTIEPWWEAFLTVLPTFLYTRLLILLLTYFGVVLFTVPNYSPQALSAHTLLFSWYRWDVIRYATIAAEGYKSLDYAAFFPLFPLLERAFSLLLHKGVFVSGMLLSNIAYYATLMVLYRFVKLEFDTDTAKRTTLYLSVFPTALFFFAAYNESLFLLFLLLCFYAMRRRSWWLAGLFGGIALFTRSIGWVLPIIFLYEFVRRVFPLARQAWHEQQLRRVLCEFSGLLAVPLMLLGLGIYAYYLNERFHDPLAFTHAQAHWHLGPTFPWVGLVTALETISRLSPWTFATAHILIDLTAVCLFFIFLVLCFVGPERLSVSQWSMPFFGLVALFYSLLFPGLPHPHGIPYDALSSMERYVLEIFPAFILLARLGRRSWFHHMYLLCALPLLVFFVLQFVNNHWTV
jgi:Gpi18-like mannosyltransferase